MQKITGNNGSDKTPIGQNDEEYRRSMFIIELTMTDNFVNNDLGESNFVLLRVSEPLMGQTKVL